MSDAHARQARIDIEELLQELQRALKVYRESSLEQQRVEQLSYVQELAAEVLELERLIASGPRGAPRSITRSARPNGLAIVIGHTREARGAKGKVPPFPGGGERYEYPWNTDLAQRMKSVADSRGIRCDLFFRDDIGIPGAYRQVREWNPQATLELHFNADRGSARGTETLYKKGNNVSKAWAQKLQDGMVELYTRTGSQNRGLKPRVPGDRGYESVSHLHPSALVEPFFGDNGDDAQLGVDLKDRQAQTLVEAFHKYVAATASADVGFWRRLFSARQPAQPDVSGVPDYLTDGACDVPEDYLLTDEQKARLRAAQPPIETHLGPSDGLYGYYTDARKYGIRQTIDALREVGRIWKLRGNTPRIGIGDISQRGGGEISGHTSHRKGIDVDIRLMTNNGQEEGTTYKSSNYSRDLTQELCDLIHANGKLAVQFILFNDPNVASVRPYPNHDNHLHVRHLFPDMAPALPELRRGSRGPTVRELQRRLNFWLATGSTQPPPLLRVDGDFGGATHDAVVAFQRAMGWPETGRVGDQVWQALPTHRQAIA